MTRKEQNELRQQWEDAIGRIIAASRLVCVFDGTDRQSLDMLSDALFNFALVDERVTELMKDV